MALVMKTSQKMAVRSTSTGPVVAARPLAVRSLRALPEDTTGAPPPAPTEPFPAKPFSPEDPLKLNTPFAGSGGLQMAAPSFTEVMGFDGAPEIINGRLAMLGFVAAMAAELSTGESVAKQVSEQPVLIAITFCLFIAASLVPAFRRAKDSLGPFTPAAELINGRAAMMGFAALLLIEGVKHSPLF